MRRLFYALWPDDEMRTRMSRVAERLQQLDPNARATPPARYHLTLRFVGGFPTLDSAPVDALLDAGGDVAANALDVVLDRVGHFAEARVGWLGCESTEALEALHTELDDAIRARIDRGAEIAFVPHVTLMRNVRAAIDVRRVEPIRWKVREFALFESGEDGYRMLRSWPLSPAR